MSLLPVKEFCDQGFLQEVNRQFFHPLGLALVVEVDEETDEVTIQGILDERNDHEGIIFIDNLSVRKAKVIEKLWSKKAEARTKKFGWVIQPIVQGAIK